MRRIRFRWWWVPVGVVTLSVVAHVVWTVSLAAEFEARLAEIRARGEPLELSEFNRAPLPDDQNAAIPMRKVEAWLNEPGNAFPESDDWEEDWTDEYRAEVRAWAGRTDQCKEWLREAADCPSWDFGVDWTSGVDTICPQWPLIQECSWLLYHRGLGGGNTRDGLECAAILFDLAPKLERNVTLSLLVGYVVEGLAIETLIHCARQPDFDARLAQTMLGTRLSRSDSPGGADRALLGERAMMLHHIREWIRGDGLTVLDGVDPDPSLSRRVVETRFGRPFAYRDGLALLDYIAEALAIAELPPWQALQCSEGIPSPASWCVHTSLLNKIPGKLMHERCKRLGYVRMARLGLDLLIWRQEHGEWPGSLDHDYIDPFTGKPLGYRINEDGTVTVEPEWWLRYADAPELIEFKRDEGSDIAWTLPAR